MKLFLQILSVGAIVALVYFLTQRPSRRVTVKVEVQNTPTQVDNTLRVNGLKGSF